MSSFIATGNLTQELLKFGFNLRFFFRFLCHSLFRQVFIILKFILASFIFLYHFQTVNLVQNVRYL